MYIIICIFDIKHAACFESTVHYARLPVLNPKLHNSHFTVYVEAELHELESRAVTSEKIQFYTVRQNTILYFAVDEY